MSNIRVEQSDYVLFVLKSKSKRSLKIKEPIGWADDSLSYTRNEKYHGILTEFTGSLGFVKEAKDYIETDFATYGIGSDLYLAKYVLKDVDGQVKWVIDYIGFADYKTRKIKNRILSINFNSNQLERIIESYEDDEFELDRTSSVGDISIQNLQTNSVEIKGRTLVAHGGLKLIENGRSINTVNSYDNVLYTIEGQIIPFLNVPGVTRYTMVTPLTVKEGEGPARMATADITGISIDQISGEYIDLASKMFYVDSTTQGNTFESKNVKGKITFDIGVSGFQGITHRALMLKYRWNFNDARYDLVSSQVVFQRTLDRDRNIGDWYNSSFSFDYQYNNLAYNEGLIFAFSPGPTYLTDNISMNKPNILVRSQTITVSVDSSFEQSKDLKFVFVHDALERLIYIMTGEKNKVLSKVFGRTEINYQNDGEYGLLGLISGLWVRDFSEDSEIYKAMILSLKKTLESLNSTLNVGFGVEIVDGVQKLRVENLDYFYQNRIIIKIGQVSNVERKTLSSDYFSGVTTGFNKGGDYENALGLDEPNTQTSRTTPINNSSKKYLKVSDIRADDTGLELTRRKIARLYPKEDTSQDLHNWYLDLKRLTRDKYTQKDWFDRLQALPEGIEFPEDYRGFLFTPLRSLLRHGWILRSGLEQFTNLSKKIKYASSKANSNLKTWFINEPISYKENDDIVVSNLDRAIVLPEEIKFTYNIDEKLLDLFKSSTQVMYQGSLEKIPNYYFKIQFVNENEEIETGYIWGLNASTNTVTVLKANDNLIS